MSILVGNPFFLDAGAGATGYQISRSLRFNNNDSAFCSRNFTSVGTSLTTATLSMWAKRSALGTDYTLFSAGTDTNDYLIVSFNSSDVLRIFTGENGTTNDNLLSSVRVFRDTSAWYHLVIQFDWGNATSTDRIKLYVNGERATLTGTFAAQNYTNTRFNRAFTHSIGKWTTGINYFSGYLADIYFIDGQALTPSSFTEVSSTTGQLIPKAYTGTFGTNGFWLKFSDNSAATATTLGKDYSGNSNNWTPNNFSVLNGNGNYVSGVSGAQTSGEVAANLFDGDTGTFCSAATNGGTVTVTFNPSRSVTSSTRIFNGSSTLNVAVNGGSAVNYTGTGWKNLGFTGTLNSISYTHGGGAIGSMTAIELDGVILLDNGVVGKNNDSLVDTPTSYGTDDGLGGSVRGNCCTWNPLKVTSIVDAAVTSIIRNGNLDIAFRNTLCLGTIGVSSGKWYWEVTVDTALIIIGVAKDSINVNNTYPRFIGQDSTSWGYYGGNGTLQTNNSASAYGATFTAGDVIGVALDCDSGKLFFSKNGIWQNSGNPVTGSNPASSSLTSGPYFPGISDDASTNTATASVNFGQRQWAYAAPAGFKALCDTNLTAPTIAKPSTVMDVKLYTGNGSTQTISGLGFSPDLVWVKSRSAGWWHVLTDTVRGGSAWLHSNVTNAEATNGLITGFTSDGFTLSASPNGTVNENNDTYVAWTWDAGSSTVPNNAGSIASQVRVNQSAGFSIVGFTVPSNGTDFTVGHGLGVTPSLIITKGRNIPDNWVTFHSSVSTTTALFLRLNTADSLQSISGIWGTALPNSTVFGGRSGNILNPDQNAIAYCFAPVAGYSAFGSYTGNGSSDGPFVFLGFRPRVLWIKETSGAGNWLVWDSARETFNVTNDVLCPNLATTGFPDEATLNLDMTSNGFKLRATSDDYNGSGATFIYCAWAESPFAYARAR